MTNLPTSVLIVILRVDSRFTIEAVARALDEACEVAAKMTVENVAIVGAP
jgi:PII-like signaling protein